MPYQNLRPILLLAALLAARPAAAQDTAATRTAQVTYVAGTSIYVGAGRDHGLAEGQELSLIRGDSAVAVLVVRFLSSSQASCEVVRGPTDIGVGETVRFVPRVVKPDPPVVAATARDGLASDVSAWGDYNRDGFLDLFVATTEDCPGQPDLLYRGLGSGTFQRMTVAEVGPFLGDLSLTDLAEWADVDNDGWPELHRTVDEDAQVSIRRLTSFGTWTAGESLTWWTSVR